MVADESPVRATMSRICTASYPPSSASSRAAAMARCLGSSAVGRDEPEDDPGGT